MRRRTFLLGSAALGVLAACGDTGSDDDAEPEAEPLPEDDRAALAAVFDPRVAPLGLRITRAGLYAPDDSYRTSEAGTHLALYAEPMDGESFDAARYLENLVPSAAATIPYALERWSGLKSADLCQEPVPTGTPGSGGEEDAFVTQVLLGRADAEAIDWEAAELVDLIAAALASQATARVAADEATKRHPTWTAAFEAAVDRSQP